MSAHNGLPRSPRDNLDTAQFLVNDLARRLEGGAWIKPDAALRLATTSTLIDIARSLRSIEGYLCNTARRI